MPNYSREYMDEIEKLVKEEAKRIADRELDLSMLRYYLEKGVIQENECGDSEFVVIHITDWRSIWNEIYRLEKEY